MNEENDEDGVAHPYEKWHVLIVNCAGCGQHLEATRDDPGYGGRTRNCRVCSQHVAAGAWSTWVVLTAFDAEDAVERACQNWQEEVEMQGV